METDIWSVIEQRYQTFQELDHAEFLMILNSF